LGFVGVALGSRLLALAEDVSATNFSLRLHLLLKARSELLAVLKHLMSCIKIHTHGFTGGLIVGGLSVSQEPPHFVVEVSDSVADAFNGAKLSAFIVDPVSAERTRVVALLDPVLDALCVEEVLLVAVEASDVLFVLEVLPANDAFFFTMEEPSPKLEFAYTSKYRNLMVEVLKPIYIHE